MTTPKRGRGRPAGDGINDSGVLDWIAEQIVRDGSIKPAQAMRSYCKKAGRKPPNESERVRWHSKWRARCEGLMTAAKERAKLSRGAPHRRSGYGYAAMIGRQSALQSYAMHNLSIQQTVAKLAAYRGVDGAQIGTFPIPLSMLDTVHKQISGSLPTLSALTKAATLTDLIMKGGALDTFGAAKKLQQYGTLSAQLAEAIKLASEGFP